MCCPTCRVHVAPAVPHTRAHGTGWVVPPPHAHGVAHTHKGPRARGRTRGRTHGHCHCHGHDAAPLPRPPPMKHHTTLQSHEKTHAKNAHIAAQHARTHTPCHRTSMQASLARSAATSSMEPVSASTLRWARNCGRAGTGAGAAGGAATAAATATATGATAALGDATLAMVPPAQQSWRCRHVRVSPTRLYGVAGWCGGGWVGVRVTCVCYRTRLATCGWREHARKTKCGGGVGCWWLWPVHRHSGVASARCSATRRRHHASLQRPRCCCCHTAHTPTPVGCWLHAPVRMGCECDVRRKYCNNTN